MFNPTKQDHSTNVMGCVTDHQIIEYTISFLFNMASRRITGEGVSKLLVQFLFKYKYVFFIQTFVLGKDVPLELE